MLQPSSSGVLGLFTGFKAHEFVAHGAKTNCVTVGPRSGQVLATGGDDKRVNVWRIGRASSIWSLTGNSSAIESLRFDPTEGFLVSGSAGGAVKRYDLTAGKMTRHFRGHMSNVTVIDCGSFDSRFVTTGSMDCQVKLWNVETKECAMAFKGHNAEITDVQFSPDGYILASAAADGQIKLWDLRASKPMHTFQACSGAVRAIRFNPQEFLLAAATSDRTVKLYDIEFMELFCVTAPDTCPTRAITFDPDGQTVYCASPSGLRRWSWDNDTASARLEAMGDVPWGKVGAGALHYNADGQQLLAASCAGSRVSVWAVDVESGDPSPSQPQHQPVGALGSCIAASSPTPAPALASAPAEVSKGGLAQQSTLGSPPHQGSAIAETSAGSPQPSFMPLSERENVDAGARPTTSRSSSNARNKEPARREERSYARDSKLVAEEKKRNGSPDRGSDVNGGHVGNGSGGDARGFQVLGRQLPLLSAAADEKRSSPVSRAQVASTAVPASQAPGGERDVDPAAAPLISAASCGGSGGSGELSRRSTRAAAVAATVAAVASAKAATDDAVASVSSSTRHRSVGTSISDTLITSANPGLGGCGDMEGGEAGATPGRLDGGDGDGSSGGPYWSGAAAWPGPAPGKEDGSSSRDGDRSVSIPTITIAVGDGHRVGNERQAVAAARYGDNDHKRYANVINAFSLGEDDTTGGEKKTVERSIGNSMGGSGVWRGERETEEKEVKGAFGGRLAEERGRGALPQKADSAGTTPSAEGKTWSQGLGVDVVGTSEGGRGGGGDSPPLLGSPEPVEAEPPAATVGAAQRLQPQNVSFPFHSSSKRPPDNPRDNENLGDVANAQSSLQAQLPITGVDAVDHKHCGDPTQGANAVNTLAVPGSEQRYDVGSGGGDSDVGTGELGMTRPRTATRRWDRPGPPGDDEVIGKILLSRTAVTSTLSNRLTHLRMLRQGWADGDVPGTISRLVQLERSVTAADDSPRAVVADFLWVVPLDGARVTLDHCLELMPLLEGLWKLDADNCVAAATRCLESIVRRFGGFVRDTLGAPAATGRVDLAREERVARCREAHRAFIRGYHHLERSEGEFYEDRRIAAVAERLRPLFESYFTF